MFSNVAIANSLSFSRNTVSEVLNVAETHSLGCPIPEILTNSDIEHMFYSDRGNKEERLLTDYEYVYNELTKPGVSLLGKNTVPSVKLNIPFLISSATLCTFIVQQTFHPFARSFRTRLEDERHLHRD